MLQSSGSPRIQVRLRISFPELLRQVRVEMGKFSIRRGSSGQGSHRFSHGRQEQPTLNSRKESLTSHATILLSSHPTSSYASLRFNNPISHPPLIHLSCRTLNPRRSAPSAVKSRSSALSRQNSSLFPFRKSTSVTSASYVTIRSLNLPSPLTIPSTGRR